MGYKLLAILLFVFLISTTQAQTKDCNCEPHPPETQKLSESTVCSFPKMNVDAYLQGFSREKKVFEKKDSILTGFKIILSDPSYKILGFKIFYSFPYDPFGADVILDDKVSPGNLKFLPQKKGMQKDTLK